MEIVSKEFKIISIKNFYHANFYQRIKINSIIENSYKNYIRTDDTSVNFNFLIDDDPFFLRLYNKFLNTSKIIFGDFDLSISNKNKCWCYKGCKSNYRFLYHNHSKTSTINSVYYYQIRKGDSISFLQNNQELTYFPSKEELLVFPNYLLHTPNKPVSNRYRYSINMEITTNQSVNKIFSVI